MELTYHGHSCIRLRGREMTVVIDPPQMALPGLAKGTLGIIVRTEGTTTDPTKLRPREGELQEVAGPGEFEIGGVGILGLAAGETTVMRVAVDDVRVVAAGRLRRQLTEEEIDSLGHVDVLVIPVGGGDALGAIEAALHASSARGDPYPPSSLAVTTRKSSELPHLTPTVGFDQGGPRLGASLSFAIR